MEQHWKLITYAHSSYTSCLMKSSLFTDLMNGTTEGDILSRFFRSEPQKKGFGVLQQAKEWQWVALL